MNGPGYAIALFLLAFFLSGCAMGTVIAGSMAGWGAAKTAEVYLLRDSPTKTFPTDSARVLSATANALRALEVQEFLLQEDDDGHQVVNASLPQKGEVKIEILQVAPTLTKVTITVRTKPLGHDPDLGLAILDLIEASLRD